jgi:hypothetical protein
VYIETESKLDKLVFSVVLLFFNFSTRSMEFFLYAISVDEIAKIRCVEGG